MNMIILTSIDEIMTCYLNGFRLSEEAQQLAQQLATGHDSSAISNTLPFSCNQPWLAWII
jgi:hypothetical protein